jgi:hypothetical protein|nr:MAG TPA: hypothetical protein [Caudoviricetes sp.]
MIIRKAFNAIKHTEPTIAGQIKVIDLVDGAIAVGPRGQYVQESDDLGLIINGHVAAGPDDDPTDADLRAAVAALLGYDPQTAI